MKKKRPANFSRAFHFRVFPHYLRAADKKWINPYHLYKRDLMEWHAYVNSENIYSWDFYYKVN